MSDDLYRLLRRWGLTELGANSVRHLVEVIGIVVIAIAVSRLTNRAARRWTATLAERSTLAAAARAQTLGSVTASVIRIAVWSFAALFILGEVGLNLGPLIAGVEPVLRQREARSEPALALAAPRGRATRGRGALRAAGRRPQAPPPRARPRAGAAAGAGPSG